jgi:hypothetical protein
MIIVADISSVPRGEFPVFRKAFPPVLWAWFFRPGSFGPVSFPAGAFRPGHYALTIFNSEGY